MKQNKPPSPAVDRPLQLLVVDNDNDFLALLCQFLRKMKYAFDTAPNGLEALRKISTTPFPLVLTDMKMPEMNGLQLLEHLKRDYPDTDVIAMTGYGESYGLSKAIRAGAIDYLTKPFSFEELEAKLQRVFRERHLLHAFKEAMDAKQEEEKELRSSRQLLEARLKELSFELSETNTALRVMLRQREQDQRQSRIDLAARMQKDIFPHLEKLQRSSLSETQQNLLDLVAMHLRSLFAEESGGSRLLHTPLTPTENRVANLIKQGKTSKEIAELLKISVGTVRSHRENLRKKLQITNERKNLYKTLLSLP